MGKHVGHVGEGDEGVVDGSYGKGGVGEGGTDRDAALKGKGRGDVGEGGFV